MSEFRREMSLLACLVVLIGGGIAFDVVADETRAAPPAPAPGPTFVERAVYCPPPLGPAARAGIAVAARGERPQKVAIGQTDEHLVLDGKHPQLVAGVTSAIQVVGFGNLIGAAEHQMVRGDVDGAAAAGCSELASDRWYFAEGSSSLGFDQRFLIFNPFPDDAVVRVTLFTPEGPQSKANLAEIPVPAGETAVVRLNEFIEQTRFVGASIVTTRGRVVAWRSLNVSSKERPDGVAMTLGARSASPEWYLPEGAFGNGVDERISLLNPSSEEAVVTVTLATAEESVQPPRLVEIPVPPRTLMPLPLEEYVTGSKRDIGGLSAIVRTSAGTVVAERTNFYTGDLTGVSSEVGLPALATEWRALPALAAPVTDAVVVVNPGNEVAEVALTLLPSNGAPFRPPLLQSVRVKPNGRVKVFVGKWTAGRPVTAIVTSSVPVAVERVASDATDVASVVGQALGRPPGG